MLLIFFTTQFKSVELNYYMNQVIKKNTHSDIVSINNNYKTDMKFVIQIITFFY